MSSSGKSKKGGSRPSSNPSGRGLKVRVKTAARRSNSSARWLNRQLNDPYVQEAKKRGYRGRAAFKIAQIDDKFKIFKKNSRIVDLGCAPGGWCQVAVERCGPGAHIVGMDLQEVEPIAGVVLLQGDFMDDDAPARLKAELNGPADIVLSDMAAAATGHPQTDHLRIMGLMETALMFAEEVLVPGGSFIGKVLQGGAQAELLKLVKTKFKSVRHFKPDSSRKDSSEMFLVATGFKEK
ncbi:RlmE family RNA methyltransferase [uncultured Kiloniella sp.]|uniref:RlmE family RNA methyltransferase n=1 Tax=Kiloniella sp. TaxID=1938587 RepID=UPI002639D853|nr:RlmE family RNA methyltransferase [uncultured Kiloniella sp.]